MLLLKAIEKLLPQKYPFLFVDEIVSATIDEIIGIKIYDSSFFYYQEYLQNQKTVPSVILIESIVQCGGAGVTQMGTFEKVLWVLATIEKVKFFGCVELGSTVKMVVKTLKISNKLIKQTGMAICEGHVVLEATWLCLRLK